MQIDSQKVEHYSSRWTLLLSMVGLAVGTGNIWRFPRIAAKYEGGAFLIPWLVFLFLWSIPIILMEYSMGGKARKGVIGSFGKLIGPQFAWMGAFVGFVSTATRAQGLSNDFIQGYQPVLFHLLSMSIGT